MEELRLVVPHSQQAKDWFPFLEFGFSKLKQYDSLIIDFNEVFFMEPDDFVMLACLIELYYVNGAEISFTGGRKTFNIHLDKIKFKDYWKEGFDREKFTLSHNSTTLCLWKITPKMIYSYSNYAKEYFEKFTDNKNLIPLASNLDEVFNNIFDHSKSPINGYIITQYYKKYNKVRFSVCDLGVGIPTSINEMLALKGEKRIEDPDAIMMALEAGVSLQSTPRNRGMGLANLISLTESSNGNLETSQIKVF